ncbi:MAG: hypothetical protein M3O70_04555 [Actinomycetota bacterium]|nr:hypothetical protein [Actinomycetota bacterium]
MRQDLFDPRSLDLFVAGDNLLKGAAPQHGSARRTHRYSMPRLELLGPATPDTSSWRAGPRPGLLGPQGVRQVCWPRTGGTRECPLARSRPARCHPGRRRLGAPTGALRPFTPQNSGECGLYEVCVGGVL